MLATLKSRRERSIAEMLSEGMQLKTPKLHTAKKLFERAAECMDLAVALKEGLRRFTRATVGKDFDVERPLFRAELGAMPYDEALGEVLMVFEEFRREVALVFEAVLRDAADERLIGRIDYLENDACRFMYVETETQKGLWSHRHRDYATTHDLVKMRKNRLPARGIEIPDHAQKIISLMPEPLYKNAWIVSGYRVLENREHIRDRKELAALGRAANAIKDSMVGSGKSAGTFAKKHGKKLGIAAAVIGGIGLAIVAAPAMLAVGAVQAVAVDPALVIDEFVLTGWE